MKTKLQQKLATVAPYLAIQTIWEHDTDLYDIREDCDGMDDEDPADWQAWDSEIRVTAVKDGEEITASEYLGGTWEKAGDVPEESNPEISGYEHQMTVAALEDMEIQVSGDAVLENQVRRALELLKGETK